MTKTNSKYVTGICLVLLADVMVLYKNSIDNILRIDFLPAKPLKVIVATQT